MSKTPQNSAQFRAALCFFGVFQAAQDAGVTEVTQRHGRTEELQQTDLVEDRQAGGCAQGVAEGAQHAVQQNAVDILGNKTM